VRILFFGTYEAAVHPRVAVLRDGLAAQHSVLECNVPLRVDTTMRVALLRRWWRLPRFVARLVVCWLRLVRRRPPADAVDAVVVGYLGVLDVHLARRLYPGRLIVLDHLTGGQETATDRGASRVVQRALGVLDRAAVRAADVAIVDTEEHRQQLPPRHRAKGVVVPVGATEAWFAAGAARAEHQGPLRVVFFGTFTPLQGAPVVAAAVAGLPPDVDIEVLLIGTGQDRDAARAVVGSDRRVRWMDWLEPAALISVVAEQDVCLGIFGDSPKARRVVPTKVFQGAAAGCAIVTSDTAPQRREFGDAAVYVPAGNPIALRQAFVELAGAPGRVTDLQRRARAVAEARFRPATVVEPLQAALPGTLA
jgi:glycosyltransferase involved in cell wall biosynthesis